MRRPIFMHQRQPTGGVRPNATQNGQTDPRTPCRSLLCRKSPLSRVGTSRQSRKSLQFAPLPSSSGEPRLKGMQLMVLWLSQRWSAPIVLRVFSCALLLAPVASTRAYTQTQKITCGCGDTKKEFDVPVCEAPKKPTCVCGPPGNSPSLECRSRDSLPTTSFLKDAGSVIWLVYWIARNDQQPDNMIIFGTGPRPNQDAAKGAAAVCSHTTPDHIQMIMFSTEQQPWGPADDQFVINCP